MPYIQRNYTHFQLIGYEVPTGTVTDAGKAPALEQGVDKDYLPVPELTDKDATVRLKRLAAIVHKAKTDLGDSPENTLKIFMAPEFYLRPKSGKWKSYTKAVKDEIVQALCGMFVHKDFTHWLFVPGTIIWESTYADMVGGLDVDEADATVIRNTAVMIKGGDKEAPWTEADKIYYPLGEVEDSMDPIRMKKPKLKELVESFAYRQKSIKQFDSLWFGIEICKDHNASTHVLKHTVQQYGQMRNGYPPYLDFHLLIAGGMNIVQDSLATRVGGYILREEGARGDSTQKIVKGTRHPFTEIRRFAVDKTRKQLGGIVPDRGETLWGSQNITLWEKSLTGDLARNLGSDFDQKHPQRLVCFEAQPIKGAA